MSNISDSDLSTLFVCAVRYSLGRQSYMPSLVQSIVQKNAKALTDSERKLLIRDINDHLRMHGKIGSDFDTQGWLNFRDWLQGIDNNNGTAIFGVRGTP